MKHRMSVLNMGCAGEKCRPSQIAGMIFKQRTYHVELTSFGAQKTSIPDLLIFLSLYAFECEDAGWLRIDHHLLRGRRRLKGVASRSHAHHDRA
jgi:hypothetical protein